MPPLSNQLLLALTPCELNTPSNLRYQLRYEALELEPHTPCQHQPELMNHEDLHKSGWLSLNKKGRREREREKVKKKKEGKRRKEKESLRLDATLREIHIPSLSLSLSVESAVECAHVDKPDHLRDAWRNFRVVSIEEEVTDDVDDDYFDV
mgnify:CR=1 FL=1